MNTVLWDYIPAFKNEVIISGSLLDPLHIFVTYNFIHVLSAKDNPLPATAGTRQMPHAPFFKTLVYTLHGQCIKAGLAEHSEAPQHMVGYKKKK